MREMLFRGKAKGINKWVYGNLSHYIEEVDGLSVHEYWIGNFTDECYDECYPNSIGQWTNAYDKNGTRIFEGDILRNKEGATYQVIFDTTLHSFDWMRIDYDENYEHEFNLWYDDFEIIGNRFDNPKLDKR